MKRFRSSGPLIYTFLFVLLVLNSASQNITFESRQNASRPVYGQGISSDQVLALLFDPIREQEGALVNVANAILSWDGSNPGDLFKAVKAANPAKPAIVSMRELNKALVDKQMPLEVLKNVETILSKQKAAQKMVRSKVLASRNSSYSRFRSNNPNASRSIYGNGDIGSWPNVAEPDASMDIDWTVFGVDPNATAELRDQCVADLLVDLAGENSGLTLADFDVVITAEGHEAAAGVFETEGGIDWAKRNMKRVTIVNLDGSTRTFELGSGDPIKEMATAEHMAKFRDLATKNGDYEKLFDPKGFLNSSLFNDSNNSAAEVLWNKYMDMLSDFGIDYYRSRSSTATGGCLDMAKHLQEEVINRKHEPKAKLKKTLKYVSRADNISRGVPGLEKILASDPLLSDPAYRDVVDLSRQISRATDAQVDTIIRERFGDVPDAGLQELGAKARRAILRMSEVAFQVEMDRIILEIPDKAGRKAALDKLTDDFRIVADEGGEYGELSKSAVEQISKVQEANDGGTIDAIKKNYNSIEKIRTSQQGLIAQTVEFLKQTKLGSKMLEKGGKLLEIGKQPVFDPVEPKYRSSTVEFVGTIADEVRSQNLKVVDYLASAAMWTAVIDDVRKSKSDAELAIALSKTLVNNTYFGMILNSAYAGIVMGDNDALGKAVMYLIVPEAALPALVEALGHSAINIGAQTLFEAQMERVYKATTFDKDGKIEDFSGLGMNGEDGAKYFVDIMCDGAPELVAQDLISRSKATDFGSGSNALAIKAIAKAIRSTVDNGNPLIFTEDGPLMNAVSGIRKTNGDISDFAKAMGVEIALAANNAGDLPDGLDKGQTGAFLLLFKQREKSRLEARQALAAAIIRTFEERRRAEVSLDSGKAKEEYEALLKIFEDLGITVEGQKSLDREGAPYNLITNWTTSAREKQITAVKAVQKFKDAYSFVLQARTSAEGIAQNNLGESYQSSPRPLTGSLPLTASPDIDTKNARGYLALIAPLGEKTVSDLELIKKEKLDGAYDADMFRKLYEVRVKIAYWSNRMDAASDAQGLHWKIEFLDKQNLYDKHSEAAKNVSDLRARESALEEEFRKHYELNGEIIVELNGPETIASGQEAKLSFSIRLRNENGQMDDIPAEILGQIKFSWTAGKADLGEDQRAQRSYKLDSVGDHVFTVVAKRYTTEAQKAIVKELGRKSWTVKVSEAKTTPTPTPTPSITPTPTPTGSPTPSDEFDISKVEFGGNVPGIWDGGKNPKGFSFKRQVAKTKIPGECQWEGVVNSEVWGKIDDWRGPSEDEIDRKIADITTSNKAWGKTTKVRAISISGFKGKLIESSVAWYYGSWSDAGYRGESISASAVGWLYKGRNSVEVGYNIGGGGCWTNVHRPFLMSQATAAQAEANAIIDSLTLVEKNDFKKVPYTGPKLDGSDMPKVMLVPATIEKLKVGDTVKVSVTVENAKAEDSPFKYDWGGEFVGKETPAGKSAATVTIKATKPGKFPLSVSVEGARYFLGSASLEYEVADYKVRLERSGKPAAKVPVGGTADFKATLTVDGKPASGNFVYRWEPLTEVTFAKDEGDTPQNTAKFIRPGKAKVWVTVLANEGGKLTTVAESNQIELDIVLPKLTLALTPQKGVVGSEIKAKVTTDIPELSEVDYRWETTANGKLLGESQDSSEITFSPQNTKPVTITVNARVPDSGDDLGKQTATFTADPVNVTVTVLGPEGPKPQVWKQGVGLVTLENEIAVHQYVNLRAEVTPQAEGMRFEWTLNEDCHFAGNNITQAIRAYRSQTGTCEATVVVRSKDGLELGRGSNSFSVTVSQADLDNAKDKSKPTPTPTPKPTPIPKQTPTPKPTPGAVDKTKFAGKLLRGETVNGQAQETQGPRNNKVWPFTMRITNYDATTGNIVGELAWPTLGSIHRIRGKMSGSTIEFTETEAIKAGGAYLNVSYKLTITDDGAVGTYFDPKEKTQGSIRIAVSTGMEVGNSAFTIVKQGDDAYENGNYQSALDSYSKALAADPNSAAAYAGRCLAKRGLNDATAAADCDRALQLDPNNAAAYRGRSMIKRANNDFQGAVADATRSIDLDPAYYRSYLTRGLAKDNLKDFAGALADYNRSIELNPNYASSYANRGLTKLNLNDNRGALTDLDHFISLNQTSSSAYNNRGLARERLGDIPGAIADYEKAIALNPESQTAKRNLAKLKGKSGNNGIQSGKFRMIANKFQFDVTLVMEGNRFTGTNGADRIVNGVISGTEVSFHMTTSGFSQGQDYKGKIQGNKIVGTFTGAPWAIGKEYWPWELDLTPIGTSPNANPVPSPTLKTTPTPVRLTTTGTEIVIFKNTNIGGVYNAPTKPTQFTLSEPHMITYVFTYHWNNARGAANPGTIGLQSADGKVYGPWTAIGSPGQGGVPNANWEVAPKVVIPPGTYTIIDSSPSTWAQNGESGGRGHAIVKGYAVAGTTSVAPTPTPVKTPQPVSSQGRYVTAIFENRSSEAVHIFAEGETFGPGNKLGPGEKREVRVLMGATGRIKFTSGRNGQVIATKFWDGDPDDLNRYPRVVFSDGVLLITTGLR